MIESILAAIGLLSIISYWIWWHRLPELKAKDVFVLKNTDSKIVNIQCKRYLLPPIWQNETWIVNGNYYASRESDGVVATAQFNHQINSIINNHMVRQQQTDELLENK